MTSTVKILREENTELEDIQIRANVERVSKSAVIGG
jgi:hypothetical protein